MQISEVRPCETNFGMDQINVENLRKKTSEKVQINMLKSIILSFSVCLLIIAAVIGIYFESNFKQLEKEWDGFKQQFQNEKEELQRKIEEMRENQVSKLGNMENQMQEMGQNLEMQNWSEFVWPIKGWAAKMQSARTGNGDNIFSEVFYSHKNGYKLCLSLFPDGIGGGRGTHLAVYFYLLTNDFNNILMWPFKHPVTLSVINQHTGIDHVSYTTLFDHFPNHTNWNKPTRDKENGFGTNKLIPLAELSSNADLFKDDTIFIRCIIERATVDKHFISHSSSNHPKST